LGNALEARADKVELHDPAVGHPGIALLFHEVPGVFLERGEPIREAHAIGERFD
jgi:hypothetical protein